MVEGLASERGSSMWAVRDAPRTNAGLARAAVRLVVALPLAPVVLLAALRSRAKTRQRRRTGQRPRLVWGPVPIISIKYWSQSLRARGFDSQTCVHGYYPINERDDFDVHFDQFLPRGLAFDPLRAYAAFLWMLRACDVYLCYFDGGFLSGTALRNLELPLLRLAGKAIIVSPYGSDIAVLGYLGPAEQPLLLDYPGLAALAPQVRRRVDHFARHATLIIRNYQYGYLPRWDVLWPTQIAIDTEQWRPPLEKEPAAGEVVVIHAPNHRHIKGTDALLEAVEELGKDGVSIRLELLERRSNAEVRDAMERSDIVADQFVAGYALFAIEGMSTGKPVLSALDWLPEDVRSQLDRIGLPIVDTGRENLATRLRELVDDPDRRRKLGEAGRQFVMEHHSFDAVGSVWEAIIGHVWTGAALPGWLDHRQPNR